MIKVGLVILKRYDLDWHTLSYIFVITPVSTTIFNVKQFEDDIYIALELSQIRYQHTSFDQIGVFKDPKILQIGEFQGPKI